MRGQTKRLLEAAKKRMSLDVDVPHNASVVAWIGRAGEDESVSVRAHKSCRKTYWSDANIESAGRRAAAAASKRSRQDEPARAPSKHQRTGRGNPHDLDECLYCQQGTAESLRAVQTVRKSAAVKGYAQLCNQDLHVRLLGCLDGDLSTYGPGSSSKKTASGALYHDSCDQRARDEARRVRTRLAKLPATEEGDVDGDGATPTLTDACRCMIWVGEKMTAGFQAGAKFYTAPDVWTYYGQLYDEGGCRPRLTAGQACPGWLLDDLQHYVQGVAVLRSLSSGPPVFITAASFSQVAAVEDARTISQVDSAAGAAPRLVSNSQGLSPEMQDTMHLYHAGMIVRRAALKVERTRGKCGRIDVDDMDAIVPAPIAGFLHTCYYGELPPSVGGGAVAEGAACEDAVAEPTEHESPGAEAEAEAAPKVARDKRPTWVRSVGSDMLYGITGGKVVTQKHVGYANSIYVRTQSAAILDEAEELGHSVSYEAHLKMRTTLANAARRRAEATEQKVVVPTNLLCVKDNPGCSDILICAMDNVNYPDGVNGTNVAIKQRQLATQQHPAPDVDIEGVRTYKESPALGASVPIPCLPRKEGPVHDEYNVLDNTGSAYPSVTTTYPSMVGHFAPPTKDARTWRPEPAARAAEVRTKELLYNLCGVRGKPPPWTGYNQTYHISKTGMSDHVDVVGQLPMCYTEAHLTSTQHTLVTQIKAVRNHVAPGAPVVITADQDVYRGLVELVPRQPDRVQRRGPAHGHPSHVDSLDESRGQIPRGQWVRRGPRRHRLLRRGPGRGHRQRGEQCVQQMHQGPEGAVAERFQRAVARLQ